MDKIIQNIAKENPYLPIEDLLNSKYNKRKFMPSCAKYPLRRNIKIHNDYWQEFQNGNISYYIFGAYYDNRPTVVKTEPVVRVLTMINFISKTYKGYPLTYCQLWFDEHWQPFITPMKEMHKAWLYNWGHKLYFNYPHFITCPLPKGLRGSRPRSISLVAKPCDTASNNVRVIYNALKPGERRQNFAVCIKGLDYPHVDMSHRFVEYIETMRSLGAEKIVMYQLQVHPNTTKVLKYYENTGFVDLRPMSLSNSVSNLPEYRHLYMKMSHFPFNLHEVLSYNDCFYRNMYRFKYLAVVDLDEIPMPLGNITNWHELMTFGETVATNHCKIFASYCFRVTTFPFYADNTPYSQDIPEYFYMLQHVKRVNSHLGSLIGTKCLHHTDYVIATHNHMPIKYMSTACRSYTFDKTVAQLQHYREPKAKKSQFDYVVDLSLWRYKDEIIERSLKVFEELQFLALD